MLESMSSLRDAFAVDLFRLITVNVSKTHTSLVLNVHVSTVQSMVRRRCGVVSSIDCSANRPGTPCLD